ncbi:MAG: hypothetical protein ACYC8T_07580 [Myxococcaceae bacterium]
MEIVVMKDGLEREFEDFVRGRLAFKLRDVAPDIEQAMVRFSEVHGPRRGVPAFVCRLNVVLGGLGDLIFKATAAGEELALDEAAEGMELEIMRVLDRKRHGRTLPRKKRLGPMPPNGSLLGRREGHSPKDMARVLDRPEKRRGDALVDTARPGRSASDRRAGGSSTARRNAKGNDAKMTYALEDSARDRPSRKSTRKSSNRAKADNVVKRLGSTTPAARAMRAQVRG